MNNKLEFFFDYACPYCLKGYEHLVELAPLYPHIEIVWRPCEAHPRPDRHGPHSDLCIQGLFYALEHGVDVWQYHERMYRAALTERLSIEEIDTLADCVKGLMDADDFRAALQNGDYQQAQQDANQYAFATSGVWVVPACRMNGKQLDARENIGITKKQLTDFMDTAE